MLKDLTTSQAFVVCVGVLAVGYAVKIIFVGAPFAELALGLGGLFTAFAVKRNAREKLELAVKQNGDAQ